MLDFSTLNEAALLEIATDPASSTTQLDTLADYLILICHPDYERPTSGVEFLRSVGPQGGLSRVMERNIHSPVVAALVANPNTSRKTLLQFAADFPEEFLNNPALMLLLLEYPDLFRPMSEVRLLAFINHPLVPADLLNTIRSYASPGVLNAIQYHINVHGPAKADWQQQAQLELTQLPMPHSDPQQSLIEHLLLESTPVWLCELLFQSQDEDIQAIVAQFHAAQTAEQVVQLLQPHTDLYNPATVLEAPQAERLHAAAAQDSEALRLLANDDDATIRAQVAVNAFTPVEVLTILELDDVQTVRVGVASNPHTPVELLDKLARDYSWSGIRIRQAVAQHPKVTPAILEYLATDESLQVRHAVLQNPQTPVAARHKMLERVLTLALYSFDPMFHVIAMGHPETNLDHLKNGVRSPYWHGRYVLAFNPAATPEILQALANDGNCFVRAAAQQRLEQSS